jgi:uridylate kinase
MSRRSYRRALLKISGEALAGDRGYGIDEASVSRISAEITAPIREGRSIAVVVGGGNILRGVDAASVGVPPLVGDQMGMLATVLNAFVLRYALERRGARAAIMCAFPVGELVEPFSRERALRHLEQGSIAIFAGGTGNPCFTTDSAAALRAAEIEADVLIKATQADGVYDRDPHQFADAQFIEEISPQDVLARRLGVIDAACVDICARKNIAAIVLNLHQPGNIQRALAGESIGTLIT